MTANQVLKANVRLRKSLNASLVVQLGYIPAGHTLDNLERLLSEQATKDGLGGIVTPQVIRGFLIVGPSA